QEIKDPLSLPHLEIRKFKGAPRSTKIFASGSLLSPRASNRIQMKSATKVSLNPLVAYEHKRDAYGFAVRPQHVQRYREYATIYKEEEEERSERWKSFLELQAESAQLPAVGLSKEQDNKALLSEASEHEPDSNSEKGVDGDDLSDQKAGSDSLTKNDNEKEELEAKDTKTHGFKYGMKLDHLFTPLRP
ncbi:Ypt/Rab-GAP domain of gyp1p superfamily protein, partial [Prunus dulcis]